MTYDISKHKTFDEQRREEKREENVRTYDTYDTYIRIQRSVLVSKTLWDSAKKYAHFLQISASTLTEKALMEFMVKHSAELPVTASFSLVPVKEKPKICGVRGCRDPAVTVGTYLPKNKEYALCEIHMRVFMKMTETWKVIKP